jgi:Ni,Fe-hydrogenase III small subunit/formate hydrogenlyase subunit 6/NADH:ubiquinone oxidoreductase subunit I
MLNILRAALRTGQVTEAYPSQVELPPARLRGRPIIDSTRCDYSGACVAACPSGAISLEKDATGGGRWQLDLARCVFCGLCEEVCPTAAIGLSNEFELATKNRADLLTVIRREVDDSTRPLDEPSVAQPNGSGAHELGVGLSGRIRVLLRRSLHIRHLDAGSDNSTDWEISALLSPVYDIQRLGIDVVASPRHADLLLVTGAVTRHLEEALLATYHAMPQPRLVAAVGAEACGGGVLQGSYAVAGGVDRVLPVDVYIPGDPPRPQALIFGLLLALDRIEPKLRRLHRLEAVNEIASGGKHRATTAEVANAPTTG